MRIFLLNIATHFLWQIHTHTHCVHMSYGVSEMQKDFYLDVSAPISAVWLYAEMHFTFSRGSMGGHWECVSALRHNSNQPCKPPACSTDPSPCLAMWSRRQMTSERSDFRTDWTTVWLKTCHGKLLPGDSEKTNRGIGCCQVLLSGDFQDNLWENSLLLEEGVIFLLQSAL